MAKKRDLLRDVFSFSKLMCFAQCPRKFFYRYVARIKEPPSEPLLLGRGTHAGQEWDNAERIEGRKPSVPEIVDVAVTEYRAGGGENIDAFAEEHGTQLDVYHKSGERDKLQPVKGTVEMPFEIDLSCTSDPDSEPKTPATVQGFVDVLAVDETKPEVGPGVVDYKTVGRALSPRDSQENLQIKLYQLGAETEHGWFVNFIRHLKQKPTTRTVKVLGFPAMQMVRLLTFLNDTITSVRKNLKSGDFPKCSPTSHYCSPTACEYFAKCYPEQDPHLGRFVEIDEIRPVGTVEAPEWRKKR